MSSRPTRAGCGSAAGTTITRLTKTTATVVGNTTTATDLLNREFAIAAGLVVGDAHLSFWAAGDWLQNKAGQQVCPVFEWQWDIDPAGGPGTTILNGILDPGAGATVSDDSHRYRWFIQGELQARASTADQYASVFAAMAHPFAAIQVSGGTATGQDAGNSELGPPPSGAIVTGYSYVRTYAALPVAPAIDTANAWYLRLVVANGVADANYETTLQAAQALIYTG